MEKTITISEEEPYRLHLPKDLGDNGYTGKAKLLINRITATVVRPDIDLGKKEGVDSVIQSLQLVIEDLKLHRGLLKK